MSTPPTGITPEQLIELVKVKMLIESHQITEENRQSSLAMFNQMAETFKGTPHEAMWLAAAATIETTSPANEFIIMDSDDWNDTARRASAMMTFVLSGVGRFSDNQIESLEIVSIACFALAYQRGYRRGLKEQKPPIQ